MHGIIQRNLRGLALQRATSVAEDWIAREAMYAMGFYRAGINTESDRQHSILMGVRVEIYSSAHARLI